MERLYDWLGHTIRSVENPLSAVSIGLHDADMVLTNGYADSVDAAVLLVTMLSTLDISAVPVLVNRGNLYSVPGVPTLGPFNHMIVFVPELELYLDANGGTVPFGSLPFSEIGKPALHLGGAGPAVRRTPLPPAAAATSTTRTILRLDRMGVMIGDTSIVATGPFLHVLNEIALQIGREGSVAAGRLRMQALGLDGTAGLTVPPARQFLPSMGGTAHIVLAPQMDVYDGTGIAMTPRLGLLPRPGDVLAGPLNLRGLAADAPTPCFPGVQIEQVTLVSPPGFKLHRLPKDVLIEAPGLRYETHWLGFKDGGAQVERKLTTSFEQSLCVGPQREALAKALIGIRREQLQQVALDPE